MSHAPAANMGASGKQGTSTIPVTNDKGSITRRCLSHTHYISLGHNLSVCILEGQISSPVQPSILCPAKWLYCPCPCLPCRRKGTPTLNDSLFSQAPLSGPWLGHQSEQGCTFSVNASTMADQMLFELQCPCSIHARQA